MEKLLTPAEVGDLLQVGTRTLERWRTDRSGPAFLRLGKHVRYRRDQVEQWLAEKDAEANTWMRDAHLHGTPGRKAS